MLVIVNVLPSPAFKAIKYLGWQLYNKTGSRSRYTTNNLQCPTSSHESQIKRQFHFLWQMYLTSLRQTALNSIKVRPNLYLNSSTNLAIVNKLSQLYFFLSIFDKFAQTLRRQLLKMFVWVWSLIFYCVFFGGFCSFVLFLSLFCFRVFFCVYKKRKGSKEPVITLVLLIKNDDI